MTTKVVIATPAYGEMFFTPYVESVFKLTRAFTRQKWDFDFSAVSYADIAESRNILLTHWYDKTDATHLLFIDADMGFESKMILDMVQLNKPVVGTIYPKRTIDLDRLAKLASSGELAKNAIANAHDFVVQRPKRGRQDRGFIEVEGCGTGIFLLQRSCIELMLKTDPTIVDANPDKKFANRLDRIIRAFDYISVDGLRLSEDYSFCHRWRNVCGGQVWAKIDSELTHIGPHRFKARYSDAFASRVRILQVPITGLKRAKAKQVD